MRPMTRREFFQESFGLILAAGFLRNLKLSRLKLSGLNVHQSLKSTLIVAQNGTPEELLTAALNKFGGIEKVVKKGDKVVIKVNISFNRTPEKAATTNTDLVKALSKECRAAGAREVLVIDHTIDNGEMCMNSSGMRKAVTEAKGKMKVIDSAGDYEEVVINGKALYSTMVSKDVLDADVFINVPIAKVHNSAVTTVSMKNLMGIVWDRGEFHWQGLHQCIADLSTVIKPDLIVLDAYRILMTGGPGGPGRVKEAGEVVVGTDPVAVDVYGSQLLEEDPEAIPYIKAAYEAGLGEMDLDKVDITYVDAQKAQVTQTPKLQETEKPEETQKPQETEKPEETLTPERSEEPVEEEEEKEVGIPLVILIPTIIVSLLIGLRMRRMRNRNRSQEPK